MKLVPKLTAALMGGTFVVLAANGYFRITRETALVRADRVRNHALVARSLGSAVSAVWRADGREEALRVIGGANEHERVVRFRWIDAASESEAHAPSSALDSLPAGDTITDIAAGTDGDRRFSYTAVDLGAKRVGFVELSETLEAERRTARTILVDTLVTTFGLIAVCGMLAALLGLWLVGRPVQALCAKARRIGTGDFSGPVALRSRDELGLLAAEMNAMCVRLGQTTERLGRETSARITALEQLRHADRLKTVGLLASGVAHELGTPLNVVSARAEMIANRESSADESVDHARVIGAAADQMTRVIRQLLAFARRQPSAKSPCDLGRLVTDTCELLRPLGEKRHVTIDVRDDAAAGNVELDAGGIQQALTNLVVNAIHAMPEGGVVEVSTGWEERPMDAPHPGPHVTLRVRDRGEGISKENLDRIFEPFFTTKDVGHGTGLGLSVTLGIIEDHGGFIDVESVVGHGSSFVIHLPVRAVA